MSDSKEAKIIPVPFITVAFLLRHHLTNHLIKKHGMTHQEALALVLQVKDEGYEPHPVLVEAIDSILTHLETELKKPGSTASANSGLSFPHDPAAKA